MITKRNEEESDCLDQQNRCRRKGEQERNEHHHRQCGPAVARTFSDDTSFKILKFFAEKIVNVLAKRNELLSDFTEPVELVDQMELFAPKGLIQESSELVLDRNSSSWHFSRSTDAVVISSTTASIASATSSQMSTKIVCNLYVRQKSYT